MIKIIFRNRYLLWQLVKKDIRQRYQGSVLGFLWTIIVPVLMLIIYTFMFSEVFQAKWDIDTSDKYQFALILFCGLSAFSLVSEVMNRSTTLIISNTNYVKKVIFPLELLPVVLTCSAFFNSLISFIILVIARLFLYQEISKTIYLFILAFLPLIIFTIGVGLLISAISVYLKDISNFISVFVTILMYMSPVFFPLSSVPENFRSMCEINPMTFMIENLRKVVLYGEYMDTTFFVKSCAIAFFFYFLGSIVFKRAKEGFADVL